jgi:sterol desaturase/sphingolipid hydroxylase (fatty acid hydroxylase superfamily)
MQVKLFVIIATIASLLILERKFPFFTFKNTIWTRVNSNFELGLVNSIASSIFTVTVANYLITNYPHQGSLNSLDSAGIAAILSLLILDLYMYFWHRAMHTLPLAWRFHRVHHTDRTMNVSTAYRFHPIEILSSSLPKLMLVWWLGISAEAISMYELVFTIVVALQHSNFALPSSIDRFLAWAIVTPNYHRIHHSQVVAETNSNYGSVLSWWDWIFQTRTARPDIINIQLGVSDESRVLNIGQLLELPLGGGVESCGCGFRGETPEGAPRREAGE